MSSFSIIARQSKCFSSARVASLHWRRLAHNHISRHSDSSFKSVTVSSLAFSEGRGNVSRRLHLTLSTTTLVRGLADRFTEMEPAKCTQIEKGNIREFLDSFDTVLTDCDGVLWNDNDGIKGSAETIQQLKEMGKRVFYVTNNSSKTREEYTKKCRKLGFHAEKEEIIGSAYVTAQYIKHVLKYSGKVYLIGSMGIKQELDNAGIPSIGCGKDETDVTSMTPLEMATLPLDPEVGCVVVGYDVHFSYTKVLKALAYLSSNPSCHFVCSNPDNALPMGTHGRPVPGTGAIVGCVEIAAGRKSIVCGKPNRPIFEVADKIHGVDPKRTIMIGDRCNTDMALAHTCGLRGLLVLTGYSKLEEVKRLQESADPADQKQVPHYYVPYLGILNELIAQMPKDS